MYTSHFGFREAPFSVTPDSRLFYTNPLYQEAFATLLYGIKAKKGFIVITGEVGTGKTTLLRKLMRNLEATVHPVYIFNTRLSFPGLLQLILDDLGLASKKTNTLKMIQELNQYLIAQLKKGHTVCLLIDEAQNLSDDTLEGIRLLSNLETDREKLLQIVLTGQPEFETKLDQPKLRQLKQRVALRCRLGHLNDREVGPFIDYRLRAAGYEGGELFSPEAVQQIAFYSKGIPRLINVICDNALLIAYAESQKKVSANMVREVSRDLQLESGVQTAEVQTAATAKVTSASGNEEVLEELADEAPQGKGSWLLRAGVPTVLLLLFIGGVALEVLRHKVNEWLAFFTSRETEQANVQAYLPSKAAGEVDTSLQGQEDSNGSSAPPESAEETGLASFPDKGGDAGKQKDSSSPEFRPPAEVKQAIVQEKKEQPVGIQHDSPIGKIATHFYGGNNLLGMDLIKEFNPQINDLNWVAAGEGLRVPPITRETLLRKQPDGSYRLVVASFLSSQGAEEFAKRVRYRGYKVVTRTRKISEGISLHRVEIEGLQTLEAVDQAWNTALRNHWVAFVGQSGSEGRE